MNLEFSRVVEHREAGAAYRLLVLESPAIAPLVRPGQFVHVRVPALDGSVLRRPFSVFKTDGPRLSILYKLVGRGTRAMQALRPGDEIHVMGPLGHGFPVADASGFPILVAGGYGVAALYLAAKQLPAKGILFVGGVRAAEILCIEDFEALGWPVRIATEDGSRGRQGLVTAVLDQWLADERGAQRPEFWACGPMGMLRAVSERAVSGGWLAWLSLDRHMGCGVGACLACVQKIRKPESVSDGAPTAWARVCKEGPVFESRQIVWDEGE